MPDNTEKIDRLFQRLCHEDTPGISLVVKQHGKPTLKASYGVCDITSMEKITTGTCFNIASLTKQFTAFGILLLEKEKKLSLDQKLRDFFPGYNKKSGAVVAVWQLLSHCSGIYDHYPYIDTHKIKHTTDADVLEVMRDIELLYFAPGSSYRYSNTAYCLLALIIEKVSGIPYSRFLQEYIFTPAGMQSSFCWNKQAGKEPIASGYEKDASSNAFAPSGPDQHVFFSTEGDGGIYTTIDDYTRWMDALQKPGIFPKEVISKSREAFISINNHIKLHYGGGWFIDTNKFHAKIYHSGSNGGYRSYCFSIPAEDYMVAVFSNRNDLHLEKLVFTINEWLIPGHLPFTGIEALTS